MKSILKNLFIMICTVCLAKTGGGGVVHEFT